jgi:hypothetical protein
VWNTGASGSLSGTYYDSSYAPFQYRSFCHLCLSSKFGWWQHSGKHPSFLQLSVYSIGYMHIRDSLSWNCLWYSSTAARIFLLQNPYKVYASCLCSVPYHCTSVTSILYHLLAAILLHACAVTSTHFFSILLSSTHSSVIVENCAHVITFIVQNDLRNNILKLWHEVLKHTVYAKIIDFL